MAPNLKPADKPTDWRMIVWAGVSDIVLGAGLIVAGLTGIISEDGLVFAGFGVVLALVGVGIVVWARSKTSQGDALGGRRD